MEQILPGVSIEVRAEGLIIPGLISISTIGMVGTASRGPVGKPVRIGSLADAQREFGTADAYIAGNELTLVRALEIAYAHGATDVIAVRVDNTTVDQNGTPVPGATEAKFDLAADDGTASCRLRAKTPGSWGNALAVKVAKAGESALVVDEEHKGAATFTLSHPHVAKSVRNRVSVLPKGSSTPTVPAVVFDADPKSGQAGIGKDGKVKFPAGEEPGGDDKVKVTYLVPADKAANVTLRDGAFEELFIAASGNHLAGQLNAAIGGSSLASGTGDAANGFKPLKPFEPAEFQTFGSGKNAKGSNGIENANYPAGLAALLNEDAHIIVGAGQHHKAFGTTLTGHVTQASSDEHKRERIGIVGSSLGETFDQIREHTLASDRIVFTAPGILVADLVTRQPVTLPGAYTAAAVAGLIAGFPLNRSLTNKPLTVDGLEFVFTQAQLRPLVQARVLAVEKRLGLRTVKGITTSTDTAFAQITTRRIVDYARYGVRSAANPYIGLLNNDRVRAALKSTINSFLSEMVVDEELVSYTLDVFASRPDETRGIARVTMVLRPTFSIDYIKVTMFLE